MSLNLREGLRRPSQLPLGDDKSLLPTSVKRWVWAEHRSVINENFLDSCEKRNCPDLNVDL